MERGIVSLNFDQKKDRPGRSDSFDWVGVTRIESVIY